MEEQLDVAKKQLAALERLEQQRQATQSSGLPQSINRMEAMNFFQRDPRAFSQFYGMNSGGFGLKGFATGGSFMVAGNGGTDRNVLSINGTPSAMVNRGERIDVVPASQQRDKAGTNIERQDNTQFHITIQVVAANDGSDPKLAADRQARDIAERLRRIA